MSLDATIKVSKKIISVARWVNIARECLAKNTLNYSFSGFTVPISTFDTHKVHLLEKFKIILSHLKFSKIKGDSEPYLQIFFSNFAKSCILSFLSKDDNIKKINRAVFELQPLKL